MGEATIYRRQEQHRDRWSSYGAADGIRHLSERLSAEALKQYPIFEGFKDRFLETISPDVSVALWREGAVLFEEGSYIDGSSHKCVHDSAPAGRPRRGKRVRMRSCQLTSGEVVCRSVDGRLRGPRF